MGSVGGRRDGWCSNAQGSREIGEVAGKVGLESRELLQERVVLRQYLGLRVADRLDELVDACGCDRSVFLGLVEVSGQSGFGCRESSLYSLALVRLFHELDPSLVSLILFFHHSRSDVGEGLL